MVAADYPGLFASITAVFDEMGLDVLSARIATGSDGRSFDLFQLMNGRGEPLDEQDALWLQERLGEALSQCLILDPVQRPMPRRLRPFKSRPELKFRRGREGQMTELEISCTDQPGLLSKLAAALHASRVNIHDAMISTLGDRVEDTFFLTGKDGQPLDDATQAALSSAIHSTLD